MNRTKFRDSMNLRSRWQHKAWDEVRLCERSPRWNRQRLNEPVKRAKDFAGKSIVSAARLRGLLLHQIFEPGASLAKPRFTPGFTLSPAPQAV